MKVLMVHNSYQQHGGEDTVVAAESHLMETHGHAVVRYQRDNQELFGQGALGAATAGIAALWSPRSFREMSSLLAKENPDVAHFHNTFPLISPAAYYACANAGVPVIQTLHNYRPLCPAATFLRDEKVCESCLGRAVAWPGIVHGCYRDSRLATASVAAMSALHKGIGTWKSKVDLYIALSEFARRKFGDGGFLTGKIAVKPNFSAADPGPRKFPGEFALYVGRLSEEKGVAVLLDAWCKLPGNIPLCIVGDGPLAPSITAFLNSRKSAAVRWLGRLDTSSVFAAMHRACVLIQPSICFENFPLAIVEAFAAGLPVIASRLGSMAEIVRDGEVGLHFAPGDARDLAAKIEWAWSHPTEMQAMGHAARAEYQRKYTPERNYQMLVEIYRQAIALHSTQNVARVAPVWVGKN